MFSSESVSPENAYTTSKLLPKESSVFDINKVVGDNSIMKRAVHPYDNKKDVIVNKPQFHQIDCKKNVIAQFKPPTNSQIKNQKAAIKRQKVRRDIPPNLASIPNNSSLSLPFLPKNKVSFHSDVTYMIIIRENIFLVDGVSITDYNKSFCYMFAEHNLSKKFWNFTKQNIHDAILDLVIRFGGGTPQNSDTTNKTMTMDCQMAHNDFELDDEWGGSCSGFEESDILDENQGAVDTYCTHNHVVPNDSCIYKHIIPNDFKHSTVKHGFGGLNEAEYHCEETSRTDPLNQNHLQFQETTDGVYDGVYPKTPPTSHAHVLEESIDAKVLTVMESPQQNHVHFEESWDSQYVVNYHKTTPPPHVLDESIDKNVKIVYSKTTHHPPVFDELNEPNVKIPLESSFETPVSIHGNEATFTLSTPTLLSKTKPGKFCLSQCKQAITVTSGSRNIPTTVTPGQVNSSYLKNMQKSRSLCQISLQDCSPFAKNHNLSLSQFLPKFPFQFIPKWGQLQNEIYSLCELDDFFIKEDYGKKIGQSKFLYTVKDFFSDTSFTKHNKPFNLVKREHGLLSLNHDDYTVDRIYYIYHCCDDTKRWNRFMDIVVFHRSEVLQLIAFRSDSANKVLLIKDAKLQEMQKCLEGYLTHLEDCPLNLLAKMYTILFHHPILILQGLKNIGPLDRFCPQYLSLTESKNMAVKRCPYIILIHTRQVEGGGSVMQKADLFLPSPDHAVAKTKPLIAGMQRCYPVDLLGNYMPYFEYKWSAEKEDPWLNLLIFQSPAPLIQTKSFTKDETQRFIKESKLKISYSLERAILQALIPWDSDAYCETQSKSWPLLCIMFLKQMCKAYHYVLGHEGGTKIGNDSDLADPQSETLIAAKIYCYSRMCHRIIVLKELNGDMSVGNNILQEPSEYVKVEWPYLFIGRTKVVGESTMQFFKYHPGCICRNGIASPNERKNAMVTPSILDSHILFEDLPDMNTGSSVQCNFDAVTLISPDIKCFGSTFADKPTKQSGVCIAAPSVYLKRYLTTQCHLSEERFKLNVYTKPNLSQGTQYSFFPDKSRGLVKLRKVHLTKFPTFPWGHIYSGSYRFNINVTILDFGSYQGGAFVDFKKLSNAQKVKRWTSQQLTSFAIILNIAEQLYDPKMETMASSVNKEYQASWTSNQESSKIIAHNKMDGKGFCYLCNRIWDSCIGIIHGKIKVNDSTKAFAQKLLKFTLFTASTPGSKISNQLENYNSSPGMTGEDNLMLNGYKLFKTLTGTVFSTIIPDPMAGCIIGLDLGYNTIEESKRHSLFVLNEHAALLVKQNLDHNMRMAKNWVAKQYPGSLHCLFQEFIDHSPKIEIPFLSAILYLEVCVTSKGRIHGCINKVNVEAKEVEIQFYSTNSNLVGSVHTFLFQDIQLAEVPATANQLPCICFNTENKSLHKVSVTSSASTDYPKNGDFYFGICFPGTEHTVIQKAYHVICPIWMSSSPNRTHHKVQTQKWESMAKDNSSPALNSIISDNNKMPESSDFIFSARASEQCVPLRDHELKEMFVLGTGTQKSHEIDYSLPPNKAIIEMKNDDTNLLSHLLSHSEDDRLQNHQVMKTSCSTAGKGSEESECMSIISAGFIPLISPSGNLPKSIISNGVIPIINPCESVTMPKGINNPGNFCYVIATTQMILSCEILCHAVHQYADKNISPDLTLPCDMDALQMFRAIMSRMVERSSKVRPHHSDILDMGPYLRNSNFNVHAESSDQQDAMEFCCNLFEKFYSLSPEVQKLSLYNLCINLYCAGCCKSGVEHVEFNEPFRIQVPPAGFASTKEAIAFHFKSADRAQICRNNWCPGCQKNTSHGGNFYLRGTSPSLIVIQYNRVQQSLEENGGIFLQDSLIDVCDKISIPIEGNVAKYNLKGFVCHIGQDHLKGHYIAYGNRQLPGLDGRYRWFKFDDSHVRDIGTWDDLKRGRWTNIDQRVIWDYRQGVVMLLYERDVQVPNLLLGGSRTSSQGQNVLLSPSSTSAGHNDDSNISAFLSQQDQDNLCLPAFNNNLKADTDSDTDSDSTYIDSEASYSEDESDDLFVGKNSLALEISNPSKEEIPFSSNEITWIDHEEFVEMDISLDIAFPPQTVHTYGQFGNRRTCGIGSSYYSYQLFVVKGEDSVLGATIGLTGPPNGVASMCVYSSQGKTAEMQLQQSKKEAHELPYILDQLLHSDNLNDREILQFSHRLVHNVNRMQDSLVQTVPCLQNPSSIRVENNIIVNPAQSLPSFFLPLPSSLLSKALAGTELQQIFLDRYQIHYHPIHLAKAMIDGHLDVIKGIHKVKNSNQRLVKEAIMDLRQQFLRITPNVQASLILCSGMIMAYIGGKFGSYKPALINDVLEEHPYEIKVDPSACTEMSEQARKMGFTYEVKESALFPDRYNSSQKPSMATKFLDKTMADCFNTRNNPLNYYDKEYGSLLNGSTTRVPKLHHPNLYIGYKRKIRNSWILYLRAQERKPDDFLMEQRISSILSEAHSDSGLLQSFGHHLKTIFITIIEVYYMELESILCHKNGEGTEYKGLSCMKSISKLRDLVNSAQQGIQSMDDFRRQNIFKKFLIVSGGNDHAQTERQVYHNEIGKGSFFFGGNKSSELLFQMFHAEMDSSTSSFPWAQSFSSVLLFLDFTHLMHGVRQLLSPPASCLLDLSKLEAIFHKSFLETKYEYIWYRPKKLNMKTMLFIDVKAGIFSEYQSQTEGSILSGSISANSSFPDQIFFQNSLLSQPISTAHGGNRKNDQFSQYLGTVILGLQPVSIFEYFLVSCFKSKVLHCTHCPTQNCKCSPWTKCVHKSTNFCMQELRSGEFRSLGMFFSRAKKNLEKLDQDLMSQFVDAPILSEEHRLNHKIQNKDTFRVGLISGITTKTVMAWRALRIAYLQDTASQLSDSIIQDIISILFPNQRLPQNHLLIKTSPLQRSTTQKRPYQFQTPSSHTKKIRHENSEVFGGDIPVSIVSGQKDPVVTATVNKKDFSPSQWKNNNHSIFFPR